MAEYVQVEISVHQEFSDVVIRLCCRDEYKAAVLFDDVVSRFKVLGSVTLRSDGEVKT